MRKCLVDEFSSVHVFHLRGDVRKNMLSGGQAGEGENVFGQGTMTGVAISVFVKNPNATEQGNIYFHDIGDNLDRKQKSELIKGFGSINGIEKAGKWTRVIPDRHGDWLNQRDDSFEKHLKIGDKSDKSGNGLFQNYSSGVVTARDAWCINPSQTALQNNIISTLGFYNDEVKRWQAAKESVQATEGELPRLEDFINADNREISWTHNLKQDLQRGKILGQKDGQFIPSLYRPLQSSGSSTVVVLMKGSIRCHKSFQMGSCPIVSSQ